MSHSPLAFRASTIPPLGPVVVLGDLMLDIYISGSVSRISPEAPVPVLLHSNEQERAGAAANVALNIAALGGQVSLLGIIGQDTNATRLRDLVEAQGVTCDLIHSPQHQTITKTRIVSEQHHQFLRIDRESNLAPSEDLVAQLMQKLDEHLQTAKALILSDYAKGTLSDAVLAGAIARANAANVPVFIDPKRADCAAYTNATVIKPNLKELTNAIGHPCRTDTEIAAACRHLSQNTGASILLTLSERGMLFFDAASGEITEMPAIAKEVFDVSGAGDTVIAVFAAVTAGQATLAEALDLATLAAGIVVSKAGTATLSKQELTNKLQQRHPHTDQTQSVFTDWDSLIRQRHIWADQGLRVGFTNGCFDLVHPGHIQLLEQAAQQCDRLIVGLNSDSSVKRLKGDSRPVQNEQARATVMAALASVDAVVLFSQDTPLDIISLLLPDVLIKGADYTEEQIVGADVVRSNGGNIYRAQLVEGQSTSNLIARSAKPERKV